MPLSFSFRQKYTVLAVHLLVAAATFQSTIVRAETVTFGSWKLSISSTGSDLRTMNESGSIFGLACPVETDCFYYIESPTRCNEGVESPVVANATSAATAGIVLCLGKITTSAGKNRYVTAFRKGIDLTTLLNSNPVLGIAIPSDGTSFKVLRFEASGFQSAMEAIKQAVTQQSSSNSKFRDAVL